MPRIPQIWVEVHVGQLFETPAEAAESAIANGAHIIGISTLAAGHKTLIPQRISWSFVEVLFQKKIMSFYTSQGQSDFWSGQLHQQL